MHTPAKPKATIAMIFQGIDSRFKKQNPMIAIAIKMGVVFVNIMLVANGIKGTVKIQIVCAVVPAHARNRCVFQKGLTSVFPSMRAGVKRIAQAKTER